jgi:membrane associated rhomboid family serine protease
MAITRWVLRLILANVLVYLLQLLRPAITEAFAFVPVFILSRPWTVLTYMFLHGDISHILFNMLGLLFFGPRLEIELGGRDFLLLYFASGLMAAFLSFISPFSAIIGASGAVYGVFMGFAYYWPRENIYIWGVLPVQARWMVAFMTLMSLFGGFGFTMDNIAHFAHLGGFLGGYLFLKFLDHKTKVIDQIVSVLPPVDASKWKNINREKLHEVNRAELDRILDKINTNGVNSLSANEREFLERFSSIN